MLGEYNVIKKLKINKTCSIVNIKAKWTGIQAEK